MFQNTTSEFLATLDARQKTNPFWQWSNGYPSGEDILQIIRDPRAEEFGSADCRKSAFIEEQAINALIAGRYEGPENAHFVRMYKEFCEPLGARRLDDLRPQAEAIRVEWLPRIRAAEVAAQRTYDRLSL